MKHRMLHQQAFMVIYWYCSFPERFKLFFALKLGRFTPVDPTLLEYAMLAVNFNNKDIQLLYPRDEGAVSDCQPERRQTEVWTENLQIGTVLQCGQWLIHFNNMKYMYMLRMVVCYNQLPQHALTACLDGVVALSVAHGVSWFQSQSLTESYYNDYTCCRPSWRSRFTWPYIYTMKEEVVMPRDTWK